MPAYRRSTSYSPHPALIIVRIVSNLLAFYTGLRSGAEQDFSTPSCPLYLVHGVCRIANSWLSGNPISMHFPLSLSLSGPKPPSSAIADTIFVPSPHTLLAMLLTSSFFPNFLIPSLISPNVGTANTGTPVSLLNLPYRAVFRTAIISLSLFLDL